MHKVAVFLILSLLIAEPTTAMATEAYTGNDLLNDCGTSADDTRMEFCFGLVSGAVHGVNFAVFDAIISYDPESGQNPAVFRNKYATCIPEEVTIGQLRDIVVKYLNDHPSERHQYAVGLILTAVGKTFACF
ncbi:MAG: Rap1a/Tai family immunity protein [Parvibaculum sp.]